MAPRPTSLTFITSNAHKLSEVRAILLPGPAASPPPTLTLHSLALDIPEIQAGSVEEIAREKCRRAAGLVGFFLLYTNSFLLLSNCLVGYYLMGRLD
jgi:inosine/xanthosine triphosphate pyrophosphatase family protein